MNFPRYPLPMGRFALLAAILLGGPFPGRAAEKPPSPVHPAPGPGQPAGAPDLALLDPVDVATGQALPGYGDKLRKQLGEAGRFRPLPRTDMEKKLAEFNWHPPKPCHEFQCGFDAGNVLLSEYVFFGTITALEGLYAYTFNVLHVPSGQVISSEAGDAPRSSGRDGDEPLRARMAAYVSGLDPSRFDRARKPTRGLMAVVDLSAESPGSRVIAERVGTHAYASRHYDLMSQQELQELLSAMDIPLASIETTDSGMIALGSRLNVAFLVHSKLSRDARGERLDLALFDIAGKRRIRDWPSKPTRDFQDILHFENRFFTTLTSRNGNLEAQGAGKARAGRHSIGWKRGLLSAAGLSLAAGFGALAYSMHEDANGAHERAESAMSAERVNRWRRETETKDRGTILFGSLAALSLGASLTLWTF